MARIRSIHPGLFTDEAFMSASPHARLLIIGLWCEAHDDGVFEWKPLTLKARVFPVDAVDMVVLMAELAGLGFIREFSFGGKAYGVIRNFRKYQRPQKPNSSGVLPVSLAAFSGVPLDDTRLVQGEYDTDPVNLQQMEDGEEEGGDDSIAPTQEAKASFVAPKGKKLEECFERFWAGYPKRDGPNPKAPAFDKFAIAVKNGADPEMIVNSAGRYADEIRSKGKERTEFVKQALTWLNQKLWKDYAEVDEAPHVDTDAAPPSPDMPSNEAMLAKYSRMTTDAADGSRAGDAGELPSDGPRVHRPNEEDRQAPVLRGQGRNTGMVGLGSVLPAAFRRPAVGDGARYERPEPQGFHRPGKVA